MQQHAYESNKLPKQEAGAIVVEDVLARKTTNVQKTYAVSANAKHGQVKRNEVGVTPVVKCFSKGRSKDRWVSL